MNAKNMTFMKQLSLFTLALLMALPTFAANTYFSKERSKMFACVVAKSIKEAYPNKSRHKLRVEILKILRKEIKPWVNAYPIPAGLSLPKFLEKITGLPGLPMSRSEYYLQNAFILYGNPKMELETPVENYFGSFIHLARKKHVSYLNKEQPRFKLRDEADLFEQIEEHLPVVANNAFPYKDSNGNPIVQKGKFKKEKSRFTLAVGNPNHKKWNEFITESQKYNHFSTPLFLWLLEQEKFSVTPEELFSKALEIYKDPIVALGVIPWVFSGDALTVNRGTSSVVSYKMKRVVEGGDIAGYQYHFWGYLTQAIIGNRLRVGTLAYVYEKLIQKDIPDWKVDDLSLRLGKQIRYYMKRPHKCE